jgi:Fe-Mn family superoxide dismutase
MNRREMLQVVGAAAFATSTGAVLAAEDAAPVAFQDGQYVLPPLPYDYNALEPHIDEQTMRLHHDRHHAAYVAGLNKALSELAAARKSGDFGLVKHWEREAAFNGSGHFLHCIFWTSMRPNGGGNPPDALAQALEADLGGVDAFKKQFSAAAAAVEGSGWAVLAYEPIAGQMRVLQAEKHQNLTQWGVVPLLVLDVWEHAYYLKYQNRRPDYIAAWWNVVNWDDVSRRLTAAKRA